MELKKDPTYTVLKCSLMHQQYLFNKKFQNILLIILKYDFECGAFTWYSVLLLLLLLK